MPPPSLARNFFEQITRPGDPVAAIRSLINSTPPTVENDWRDFKTEHRDPKQRDKKRSEMWSEALGGFANNQGGVLIWGIDARKTAVGGVQIDAACGEWLVDDPHAVRSRLIELQRSATDPPTMNVEIEAYDDPGQPGKGFVVCFIPEGKYKPYRSEQAGQNFYLRAGDNTVVMSRSVLQSMFYPQAKAIFRVRSTLSWSLLEKTAALGHHFAKITCFTELVNVGSATARNIVVRVARIGDEASLRLLPNHWFRYDTPYGVELETERPMHPHREMSLFSLEWKVAAKPKESVGNIVVPDCTSPSFDFVIFCEHHEPQSLRIAFDMAEMLGKLFEPDGGHSQVREATPEV